MNRTTFLVIVSGALLGARPTSAQPTGDPPNVDWTVTAGAQSFSYRDVARSGPPVDASPVSWDGTGETIGVRYERSRPARLHRYDVTISSTGGFSYVTPLRSVAADSGDSARWVAGRYEYRRRWFSRVLPQWLDAGIGAQALGGVASIKHIEPPSNEAGEDVRWVGGAGVLSARLQRWRRLGFEATWINGVRLGNVTHVDVSGVSSFGGGWQTETALRGDVSLTSRASIVVEYTLNGEGMMSTHHGYAVSTRGIVAGVRYGR